MKTLGDHLRNKRLDLGLDRKSVADQIRVRRETVKKWESNETRPALPHIPRIIEFLGYCPYDATLPWREKLKIWREALGFSQERLALTVGIHESTIQKWERGSHRPTGSLLRKMKLSIGSIVLHC